MFCIFTFTAIGPVASPFDCFLVNRGLKTLHVRMKEHMKNGLAVAKFLESNPRVVKVLHPGKEISRAHDRMPIVTCPKILLCSLLIVKCTFFSLYTLKFY